MRIKKIGPRGRVYVNPPLCWTIATEISNIFDQILHLFHHITTLQNDIIQAFTPLHKNPPTLIRLSHTLKTKSLEIQTFRIYLQEKSLHIFEIRPWIH